MSSCRIQLDNYLVSYNPGDVINGNVICPFDKTRNIRGIIVSLKGEERNEWVVDETRYSYRRKRFKRISVHYNGHETFLCIEMSLQGEGDIGPGVFKYPFTFQLPANLPGSFQGRFGGIFYNIAVKVDSPYKFDYTDTMRIEVTTLVNLNLMKDELQLGPTTYSVDKTICCWCCKSDPITMEVHLEKEAFLVGEVVKVRVDVTNMSSKNIERMLVKLGTDIKSMVTHPNHVSKSDYELLATSNDSGVGAHGNRTYNFTLEIPESAQVHNFNLCQLFSETTKLEVTAVLPGCSTNMETVACVIVGNIPVDILVDAGPSAPPPEDEASAPSKMDMTENQFGMMEQAPPSYSEAMSQASNLLEINNATQRSNDTKLKEDNSTT